MCSLEIFLHGHFGSRYFSGFQSQYCPERRPGDKFGLPSSLNVLSEIAEVSTALLDSKVTAALNKYADLIDYIHFSDQFSGPKQTE